MTKQEKNQYLTEQVGECWHINTPMKELPVGEPFKQCPKCYHLECDWGDFNPDFSTAEGFFKLWNWAKEQEWFPDFLEYSRGEHYCGVAGRIDWWLINPTNFANALTEFLEEGESL